jgi:hypothetical protein
MADAPLAPDWLARLREQLIAIHPDMATDEDLLFDALDGQSDVPDQLRTILRHGLEAEIFADALTRHIDLLRQRQARFKQLGGVCRQTVKDAMDALGITRLTAPDFTASIQKGRPRVVVSEIDDLPEEYVRTTTEPNLAAIADALKAGNDVPGASWSNAAPIIVIRRL